MTLPLETDAARSALMGRVRQRGTKPELRVAAILRSMGAHYRLNARGLPGSPDFSNRRRRWAVFVHGCYWHHHTDCKRATIPTRNREFWLEKFHANRARDAKALRALRRSGFRVAVVWECELSDPSLVEAKLSKILEPRRVDVP
ncbi:very short patch repair endonuclease [Lutibaculum baratangense]|uniref:very short patch repair endonuclease n=1 Tax=Lutibaculum baratangense TaxID=1358440 RepID=UPI0009DD4908|nr:very short patch repair endonuclease [Lutibaculum baratangense]